MTTEDAAKKESEAAARIARRRSIAIALILGFMVLAFYAATLVRFGNSIPVKVG